jgi:hypothetical protein
MIDIRIKAGGDPQVLAELISTTVYGVPAAEADAELNTVGKLVREQQEQDEQRRPSREQIETVDFAKIDDELDWSDL